MTSRGQSARAVKWDAEVDVLVAGFGLAGACAAIEAHDADPRADLLIVEKMPPEFAGGNTRASGQALLVPTNAEALANYQRALSARNPVPEDMLRAWAERMAQLEPWMQARIAEGGATYAQGLDWSGGKVVLEFPDLGAADAVARVTTVLPMPGGLWEAFRRCVESRRSIRVEYGTALVELVQDADARAVRGAIVEQDGRRVAIRARRGVVVATGGFANDRVMQRDAVGLPDARPLGTPAATGDGVRILEHAGAKLWHIRNPCQSSGIWPAFAYPGHDTAFLRTPLWRAFSWIDVGGDHRRFCNETGDYVLTHYKHRVGAEWKDLPYGRVGRMHMILDEGTRTGQRLGSKVMTWNAVVHRHAWSEDNSTEIARGWIARAGSIEGLAHAIERDPAALVATVERYNAACAAGRDAEFQRSADTLRPVIAPPFYAIEIVPGIVGTSGGAVRNVESEVLDHEGRAIPGLYEAGELGSMISDLFQNGAYLTEAMISGRAAGANAVRRCPRT